MRLLIIILFFSCKANATTYYVSNSGSDAAAGTSTATAWQTIAKVNATVTSGDIVYFKAGGSWNERLNVPASNITFGAYGTGAKPLITGLQTLTGWTDTGGNIWKKYFHKDSLKVVLVGGAIRAKARTPNTGYSTVLSYSGSPNITSVVTGLSGTPNYTGGEFVGRDARWLLDVVPISSQSTGTLNFSSGLTYDQFYFGTNGYFIQNHISALDIAGEWVYQNDTLYVYATSTPNVQASSIDTLVHIDNRDNITFTGLSFEGANKVAFQLDTTENILINNCKINNIGQNAITALAADTTTISNDSITNCLSGALFLRNLDPYDGVTNACNNSLVENNYFKNIGHLSGMGMSAQLKYSAIVSSGHNSVFQYNRFDSIGYIGIFFNGKTTVYRNHFTNFCFTLDDGAAVYTGQASVPYNYTDSSIIRSNIIVNPVGVSAGTSTGERYAATVYLDYLTRRVTIDSVFGYGGQHGSLYTLEADSNIIKNSTFISANDEVYRYAGNNTDVSAFGNTVTNNIFYSSSSTAELIYRYQGTNVGGLDSNFYSRPLDETNTFDLNGTSYSLAGWKTATGKDAHSVIGPSNRTSDTPVIHYNATTSDSTIVLSGWYTDLKGNIYGDGITLTPFTSAILFPIAAPVRLAVKVRRVQNL